MAHKMPRPLAGNQGTRRRQMKLARIDKGIIPNFPVFAKQNRRPASPAQVRYLQALRLRVGLDRWNELKHDLGITTPGTHGLGMAEAAVLIESILAVLQDGDK